MHHQKIAKIKQREKPNTIRMDNDHEFILELNEKLLKICGINFNYIQTRKAIRNSYIEILKGTYRRRIGCPSVCNNKPTKRYSRTII